MIKHAIILAAGVSKRLQNLLKDKPKAFLEFDGRPIIQRSINLLKAVGVEKISIVGGYQIEHFHRLAETQERIEIIENPDYAISGSLYSLYLAKEKIKEPFLLLESDLIYEPRALEVLVADPKPNLVLISGFSHAGDEVYISGQDQRIEAISKKAEDLNKICGELVGISKLTPAFSDALFTHAEALFNKSGLDFHYEEGISKIANQFEVNYCKVEDLIWTEIDDESHYQRALNEIWPRLVEKKYLG